MRTAANRDTRCIALHQLDAVQRHAEPFADQLAEAGLVPLAARHCANDDFYHAVGFYGDLRPFARYAGRRIDIVGDADAATFAGQPRLFASRGEPWPVG